MDKTVDLFSLFLHSDFREVVVLTQKQNLDPSNEAFYVSGELRAGPIFHASLY